MEKLGFHIREHDGNDCLVEQKTVGEIMDAIFYYLLNMGITAVLIGLPVCLLRLFRQVPRFLVHLAWAFVGIRLMIPFTFSSNLSLLSLGGHLVKRLVPLPGNAGSPSGLSFSNVVGTAQSYSPLLQGNATAAMLVHVAAIVWLTGACLGLAVIVFAQVASARALSLSSVRRDGRWFNPNISTPSVFGLFHQRILLPDGLAADAWELAYVDRHEQVHMRRHDNLVRFLTLLVVAVHWYNPFAWLYLRWFFEDMELSCDAGAVRTLPPDERVRYAKALVNLGAGRQEFPRAAFAGTGGGKVKHRVTAVLERVSHPLPIGLLLVLFFAILGVSLLSNPRMPPKPSTSGLPVVEVMNALSSQFTPAYVPAAGVTEAQAKTLCLDWLKLAGYTELREDMLQIFNTTREEGWNNEKMQIFSVSGYGWDYGTAIIRDGKVLNILSGMAMLSLWLADLDADGLYECYGNAAFGSGIVNMEVLGYNPAARKAYKLSNRMVEDYNLSVRDGVLVVDVLPYGSAGSGSSKDRVTMRLALNGGKMVLLPMEAQ